MVYPIHILRGVCAWMVVIHHFAQSYLIQGSLYPPFDTIAFILGIGVDVFFVISGYVMSLTLERSKSGQEITASSSTFLIKRITRILPAWWFYLALFILLVSNINHTPYALKWDIATLSNSALLLPHFNLNNMGPYPILYVGWSLMYEIFFYGLIGALLILPSTRNNIHSLIAITLTLLSILANDSNLLLHSNFFFLEFLLGFLFRNTERYVGGFIYWSTFAIFLLYGQFEAARFMLASTIFTIFMHTKLPTSGRLMKTLSLSGDVSYSIYLSHLLIIGIVYWKFPPSGGILHDTVALLIVIVLTFIMAILTFKFVEQPFQRLGRFKRKTDIIELSA